MKFTLSKEIELISSTPNEFDHSVGYHDIKPFNKGNDDILLVHRYPKNTIGPKNNIPIDICIWDHKKNIFNKISDTTSWSWEQGSRLQWLDEENIIFNHVLDGKLQSCKINIKNPNDKNYYNPIYSLNKNKFLSLNYNRIWKYWKNYGYFINNHEKFNPYPDDDGIFLNDFIGNKKLILSIKDAVNLCGLKHVKKTFFLVHPTFNPSGDKMVSILRFINDGGNLISYFICTNLLSLRSQILARERVSHFEWVDNNKIVIWCRMNKQKFEKLRFNYFTEKYLISNLKKIINLLNPSLRQKLISTHYYLIDLENELKNQILDQENLIEDGHPQISTNCKFLITDTYADINGYQKLLLYEFKKNKTYELGKFKVDTEITKNGFKYDLHPRWNYNDNLISIDSSHEGSRQSYVLNIGEFLRKII